LSSAAPARSSQSDSTRTSSSVVTMMAPAAARMPALSAALRPCTVSRTARMATGKVAAASRITVAVPSDELLSTTISSHPASLRIVARLSSVRRSSASRL